MCQRSDGAGGQRPHARRTRRGSVPRALRPRAAEIVDHGRVAQPGEQAAEVGGRRAVPHLVEVDQGHRSPSTRAFRGGSRRAGRPRRRARGRACRSRAASRSARRATSGRARPTRSALCCTRSARSRPKAGRPSSGLLPCSSATAVAEAADGTRPAVAGQRSSTAAGHRLHEEQAPRRRTRPGDRARSAGDAGARSPAATWRCRASRPLTATWRRAVGLGVRDGRAALVERPGGDRPLGGVLDDLGAPPVRQPQLACQVCVGPGQPAEVTELAVVREGPPDRVRGRRRDRSAAAAPVAGTVPGRRRARRRSGCGPAGTPGR